MSPRDFLYYVIKELSGVTLVFGYVPPDRDRKKEDERMRVFGISYDFENEQADLFEREVDEELISRGLETGVYPVSEEAYDSCMRSQEYQIEGVTEPNETIQCCDKGLKLIQQFYEDVPLPRRIFQ